MEKSLVKKRGLAAMFYLSPAAHVIALLGACFVALFFSLRHDTGKMRFLSQRVVQPLHHALARLTAQLPFSLAEWLYAAAIAGTLVYIFAELLFLVQRPQRLKRLYRLLVRLAEDGKAGLRRRNRDPVLPERVERQASRRAQRRIANRRGLRSRLGRSGNRRGR